MTSGWAVLGQAPLRALKGRDDAPSLALIAKRVHIDNELPRKVSGWGCYSAMIRSYRFWQYPHVPSEY